MNIINMKSSEKEKSFQSVIKNKEIAFIIILSVIFLIFQISAGRIKNFEHRIFIIELFKMPYMFLLPFFMIRKEKPEKNQTLFYVISGLVLVLIAIVNKWGYREYITGINMKTLKQLEWKHLQQLFYMLIRYTIW